MARRSLTIEKDVDIAIQHYRASLLEKYVDTSYTKAVNDLLRKILKQGGFIEKGEK